MQRGLWRSLGSLAGQISLAAPGWRRAALRLGLVVGAAVLATSVVGCAHDAPIKPWQRAHYTRRSMRFDDGLEGKFRQHLFGAREGAEGGYGQVGGGCGCN
jgi:hypothetical protein